MAAAANAATARRPSRASRSAAAAAKDQVVPITTGGRSTTGENEHPPQVAAAKPPVKPAAQIDVGARQVTYWFPSIVMPDGTRMECAHKKYGHESESSARKCARSLATQNGCTAV
jgi:hypothetical protein